MRRERIALWQQFSQDTNATVLLAFFAEEGAEARA
jgi:hypothetical protein